MQWTLAQMNADEALAKGYWNLAMIVLVGLLAVVFFVTMFLLRRWKHRQLKAIDERRAARRAKLSGDKVDAWAASSERYIDHDKLSDDDDVFEQDNDDEDAGPPPEPTHGRATDDDLEDEPANDPEEEPDEERDPYGLFSDQPYQDPDDDDDDDIDDDDHDDEDWEDDEDGRR